MQIEPGRRAEGAALDTDGVPVFLGAGSEASGDYHCADCGYGISVRRLLPVCPMCRGDSWEGATSTPLTRLRV